MSIVGVAGCLLQRPRFCRVHHVPSVADEGCRWFHGEVPSQEMMKAVEANDWPEGLGSGGRFFFLFFFPVFLKYFWCFFLFVFWPYLLWTLNCFCLYIYSCFFGVSQANPIVLANGFRVGVQWLSWVVFNGCLMGWVLVLSWVGCWERILEKWIAVFLTVGIDNIIANPIARTTFWEGRNWGIFRRRYLLSQKVQINGFLVFCYF